MRILKALAMVPVAVLLVVWVAATWPLLFRQSPGALVLAVVFWAAFIAQVIWLRNRKQNAEAVDGQDVYNSRGA